MSRVTVAGMAEQRYLTQKEAAEHLRISVRYLSRETAAGNIPAIRLGRRVNYLVDDLDAYAAQHRRTGSGSPEKPTTD